MAVGSHARRNRSATVIWPFRKKSRTIEKDAVAVQVAEARNALWMTWAPEQRVVISIEELKASFVLTEEHIIEFASKERSMDPCFQDEFTYLCHQLKSLRSPGLLKLLDFGSENERLFRIWERREIRGASFDEVEYSAAKKSRRLLELLDGFRRLRSAGVSVEDYETSSISTDYQGFFIARFPFTARECPPRGTQVTTLVQHIVCTPPGFSKLNYFLLRLGTFVCAFVFRVFPYQDFPAYYQRNQLVPLRTELDCASPLVPVVHRLTELDPAKGYGSLEEAFLALTAALKAYGEPPGTRVSN